MSTPAPDKPADGRVQRSLDSRQKIIAAIFSYCDEGVLIPTAQEVATRAGVGLRTVFRHFNDMDSLFVEMNHANYARIRPMVEALDRTGSRPERIARLVAWRARLYEEMGPYMASTQAQLWRSTALQEIYTTTVKRLRDDLEAWLPELADKGEAVRFEVETLVSFEAWNRARRYNKIARKTLEAYLVERIEAAVS